MQWKVRGSIWADTPVRASFSIVGDNKRKHTQLVQNAYEIVYDLCNLLIISVFRGA